MGHLIIALMLTLVLGFIIGVFFSLFRITENYKRITVGKLVIDTSDSDGPYCFLELNKSLAHVKKQQVVMLEIDTNSYISQK